MPSLNISAISVSAALHRFYPSHNIVDLNHYVMISRLLENFSCNS